MNIHDISYTTASGKQILNSISGCLHPGQLVAVLGGSGAGKTTFLDAISGRIRTTGTVERNGKCTYIEQQDKGLLSQLTVRETITYYGRIIGAHESHINDVISNLGLLKVQNLRIKALSGGERRRTYFAKYLLQDPSILLLDEPTTQLDAYTAFEVMKTVASEAKTHNRVVVCTIHQPRYEMIDLFDQIIILSEGRVVYFSAASRIVAYFSSIGYEVPEYQNPMDTIVNICTVDFRDEQREKLSRDRISLLVDKFKEYSTETNSVQPVKLEFAASRLINPSGMYKYYILTLRMWLNLIRSPSLIFLRACDGLLFAFVLSLFVQRLGLNQSTIQSRMGLIYQLTTAPIFIQILTMYDAFPEILEAFQMEKQAYGPLVMLAAFATHGFPFNLVGDVLMVAYQYAVIGMHFSWKNFGEFVALTMMGIMYGESLGLASIIVFQDRFLAQNFASLFMAGSSSIGTGIIRSFDQLPFLLKFATNFAFQRYNVELVMVNEMRGLEFECVKGEVCLARTGEEFLAARFPHEAAGYWTYLICLLCVFLCVPYVLLKVRVSK